MIRRLKKCPRLIPVFVSSFKHHLDFEYVPVAKRANKLRSNHDAISLKEHSTDTEPPTIRPTFQPNQPTGPCIPQHLLLSDTRNKAITYFKLFFTDSSKGPFRYYCQKDFVWRWRI